MCEAARIDGNTRMLHREIAEDEEIQADTHRHP